MAFGPGDGRPRIRRRIRLSGRLHATTCDSMRQVAADFPRQGVGGRPIGSPGGNGAPGVSGIGLRNWEAEREGFEPSVTLPPHRFSRPAHTPTPTPQNTAFPRSRPLMRGRAYAGAYAYPALGLTPQASPHWVCWPPRCWLRPPAAEMKASRVGAVAPIRRRQCPLSSSCRE